MVPIGKKTVQSLSFTKTMMRDSIHSKVFEREGMGFGEGGENFLQKAFSPFPNLLAPLHTKAPEETISSGGIGGERRAHPRAVPWSMEVRHVHSALEVREMFSEDG